MARIQVGVFAKRNMETGEFGPAMPIYREVNDETPATVFEIGQKDLARYLAKKMRDYITKTKMEEN